MSFRWKVFSLCIAIYIITLGAVCIVVTEDSYQSLLKGEVERCLQEQGGIHSTASLYIVTNQKENPASSIADYGQRIVDIFTGKDTNIELFDQDIKLAASDTGGIWNSVNREELNKALAGDKNYIFRRNNGKHYLFISELMNIENQKMVMTVIKDVTHVDKQRQNQYIFFLQFGLIGLIFTAIVTGMMSKVVISPIERLTSTVKKITSGNYKERVKDLSKDEVGQLAGQFNIMADEIEKRIYELREEGDRKQLFIDNLTHELRTPLTSIIGFSEFLRNTAYDEDVYHKSLNYINSEGNRMLKLINQLMDMILLRQNSLKLEPTQIYPLFEETAGLLANKAQAKQICLNIQAEDFKLNLDRDLIKGVLINLTDNAINASKAGTQITLGTIKDEENIILYVKDEGKGMEKEDIDKVIQPFYRVDKSRARKGGGLGLGLSICSEIIKAHGARLQIESELGKGTIVKILF